MSLAEELYQITNFQQREAPPVWLDTMFLIVITIVHIIYASKFTTFSLSYLKAKCDEKTSRSKWSESKLYLRAVLSHNTDAYAHLDTITLEEENKMIYTKLWTQLSLLRNILRILISVCCCIILILYLSFILNLLYEYFVVCIVNYMNGSLLALLILPFLWFVNVSFIRFLIYGMMASWSINVDNIADNIAYQQHHLKLKQYAHKDDDDDIHGNGNENITDSKVTTFKTNLKGFTSEYFMAVHWRLSIIICSVIATILALPSFASFETDFGETSQLRDSFWCQLFLRYILLAMTCWLVLYFCLTVAAAVYGRIATFYVYNEVLDKQTDDDRSGKNKNAFLRLFCLIDIFGIKDKNAFWIKYKTVVYGLFVVSGFLCIIVGSAIDNGLIRFVGIINILYYVTQLLLNCKVRGIYYLWRSDMISLELKNWWHDNEVDDTNQTQRYQPSESHAAGMTFLGRKQLQRVLSHHILSDIDALPDNEEHELAVMSATEDEKHEDEEHDFHSEEDIFTLFTSTYSEIYNERRNLYAEKQTVVWYKNFCEIVKIHFKILYNYFYATFKLYKMYWLLILPYHFEIRPLSGVGSGKSLSERLANYKYSQYTCFEILKQGLNFLWHATRGIMCCGLLFLVLLGLLYLSVGLNQVTVGNEAKVEVFNNNMSSVGLYSTSNHYEICQTKWNANLSVFDLASLAHVAYEIEEDPNDQIMSMQELMCLYFDRIKPTDLKTTALCTWQIVHISRSSPAFFHIRHNQNKTDVIAIRGTWTAEEMSQDIALFNEVALLQTASWVIPLTTILPQSFLIRIVYFASWFEGRINYNIRARFDEPLFEYCYNYLLNTENEIKSFYYIGHSLGGGIAQIVAAQLYHSFKFNNIHNINDKQLLKDLEIKSFSLAAPGLVWNSRKFSIDVVDLYETATLLRPRHDIVSGIDKYGGLTQNIECAKSKVFECHLTVNTICQLVNVCNVYDSHNPNLIQAFCQAKNGELYMGYANYSA